MKTSKLRIKRKIMIPDFKMEIIEKVKYLVDMINDMDLINKLRLAICICNSSYTNLKCNNTEK